MEWTIGGWPYLDQDKSGETPASIAANFTGGAQDFVVAERFLAALHLLKVSQHCQVYNLQNYI